MIIRKRVKSRRRTRQMNKIKSLTFIKIRPFVSEKMSQNSDNHGTSVATRTCTVRNYKRNMSDEQPWEQGSHWAETETCIQSGYRTSPGKNYFKATGNESVLNANALTFEPTENHTGPSIGQDLWRQLKSVQIPVFSGR